MDDGTKRIPKTLGGGGVVYTRSEASGSPRHAPVAGVRRAPKKSQLAAFYALTIVIGVIICIAVFGIVLNTFSSLPEPSNPSLPPLAAGGGDILGSAAASLRLSTATGVVSSMNITERRVRLVDAETREPLHITIAPDAAILNRAREDISIASLSIGDILDVRYDPETYVAESIALNPIAWEHRQIRQLQVHPERTSIGIGIDSFSYDEDTLVLYRGHNFNIERISPVDIVTVRGLRSNALFVEVHRAHGTLQLLNIANVEGGTIEVNTSIFRQLQDAEEVHLLEGPHRVVVRGDNIEPFIREITIEQGQLVQLDLDDVQFRNASLTINVNTANYTIMADDEPASSPITRPLGSQITVSVTSPGYVPFLQVVELNQPNMALNVELQQPVAMSMLVINTVPSGANVFVNNSLVGSSPISYLTPQGLTNVVITMPGFENWSNQFNIDQARQEYQIVLTSSSPFPTASPSAPGMLPQAPPPAQAPPPSPPPAPATSPAQPATTPTEPAPFNQPSPQPFQAFPEPEIFTAPPPLPPSPPPPLNPPTGQSPAQQSLEVGSASPLQPTFGVGNGATGIRFSEIEEFRHE